jgi:pilus assembly protein CpaE
MRQMKVLIASRCRSAADTAKAMLDEYGCRADVRLISNGSLDPLRDLPQLPDLLLLYDHNASGELETLMAKPAAARPELLVFGPGDDPRIIRLAMRAGARDYLTLPLQAAELHAAIDAIRQSADTADNVVAGRIQVFMNGKGGAGATFLATNAAHGLACENRSVTLVDLDLQFAGLCRYLDLTPKQDIVDAVRSLDDMDELAAEAFTTSHESGLRLLAAKGDRLLMNEDIPPKEMVRLLEVYRSFNDFVIVDLPDHIDALNAAVLEHADNIVLVMQQSFPYLNDMVRLMNILTGDLHIERSRITVVVNRFSKNLPILMKDIEAALHTQNIVTIPNNYKMSSESVNSGIPLSQLDRKSPIARGLKDLYVATGAAAKAAEGRFGLPALFRR